MSAQVEKELRQIRGIMGKMLQHLGGDAQTIPRYHNRDTATAKNVTRLTTAALWHLDAGHTDIAKQLLILLQKEEGLTK